MPSPKRVLQYMDLLYQALAEPYGIELVCSNAERVAKYLSEARREAKDPDLAKIAIITSPFDPSRIWLMQKEPPNEKT